jgi:DNA-directed RNA polymerase beta subunit
MNYSYGINAKTLYLIDNRTIEDAMVCSESLAKKLVSAKFENIKITLNDNDLLGNLYGNNDNYKSFPDIGEKVKNSILANVKRVNYAEALYDLKQENLMKINYLNDKPFYVKYPKNARVIDINIYSNKPIKELDFEYNTQIVKYLKLQEEYYKKLNKILGYIINSGAKYSDDVAFMYKRSSDILNPDVKWKDDKSYFNHIIIEFLVESESGISNGNKLVGRYGDKGVLSTIVKPDDQMPTLENGERVDLICNVLGIINRENPGQLYEVELNFIANRIREKMTTFDNLKDKRELLFKFIKLVNPEQHKAMSDYYETLDEKDKIHFILDSEKNGIYIHQPPFWDNIGLDVINIIYKEFDWIQGYDCYINFHGRRVKMLNKVIVGEKYIMKLKHDPLSKFSSRSMGHLSPTTDTPCKSMGSKNNVELYSKTPIRFGEMEINNMSLNKNMTEMRRMVMMYSSSIKARRNTKVLYTNNILDMEKIDIGDARNKNADILAVYLKSAGSTLKFKVKSKYRKVFKRYKGKKIFRNIDDEWEE